jgi:hypothetical protein
MNRAGARWIENLGEATRLRFVNALTASLTKLDEPDFPMPKMLLGRVPDLWAAPCVSLNDPPPSHQMVVMDGQSFNAQFLFSAISPLDLMTADDKIVLFAVYCQLTRNLGFFLTAPNCFFNDVVRFISQKCPKLLIERDDDFTIPAIYPYLFFKHNFLPEQSNAPIFFHEPYDFLNHCCELCTHPDTASTAVSLIESLIGVVSERETLKRKAIAVIQSGS